MNCANHPQTAATAYCRTCGKPVCESCKRDVHGVIYCEDCLAARVGQPAAAQSQRQAVDDWVARNSGMGPMPPTSGPNPAIAAILSACPSFGTGMMYCGEFMRALVHGGVFIGLIAFETHEGNLPNASDTVMTFGGLLIAFWYFFMIFDSIRVAKAKQRGEAVPDLYGFGLGSPAEPVTATGVPLEPGEQRPRLPIGAFILIGIGVLFLLGNIWDFDWIGRLWPLILIALGVRLFFRRTGRGARCGCVRCTAQCSMGAAVLTTLGVLFLLQNLSWRFDFGRTWPFLLIVIGIVAFLRSSGSTEGHIESAPPVQPQTMAPPSEVHNG